MSATRPRLEVVEGGASAESAAPAAQPPPVRRRAVTLAWVLAALLVLAVAGMVRQGQRAGALESRVTGLEADLQTAQGALNAHREHLGAVRASVAELQALVEREPTPATPSAPDAPH